MGIFGRQETCDCLLRLMMMSRCQAEVAINVASQDGVASIVPSLSGKGKLSAETAETADSNEKEELTGELMS